MKWGAAVPLLRGPVVGTTRHGSQRNVIGAHSGGYSIYKALAVVSGGLDPDYYPKLGMTTPVAKIGPFAAWHEGERIVTMDPYGHAISEAFGPWLRRGYDVRPTIAVTKAHIELPESKESLRMGRLKADGEVLTSEGQSFVTKAAIEPVWHLPGIAKRFEVTEEALREAIYKETNSMYPELLTRMDLKLFLPPIGGMTVYIWGDVEKIPDESYELTCRVHDECNGSDVFGSDICTCRPYLIHAIEESIKTAQRGGTGVVVYFRKEGRALGEVTKYLVYNMRKRQQGGDRASEYFNCTHTVAGVTDTRFQTLMPDVLHWLGVTRIHRFISMSDMKYNAIVASGIKIDERVEIPPELVPKDAQVEITAKVFHGYHGGKRYKVDVDQMNTVKGREYSKELSYSKSVKEGGGAVDGAAWNEGEK
jgi:GTP cyclohydrolase II